jgi:predicted nucleotidyltransferase
MMQKLWQKKPKLKYTEDVFDIVQFGSSVKEKVEDKPRDIDIAVIFKPIPIKDQLNQAQEIKKQLQKITEIPIHISPFDLYSFFNPSNFAKENILFYGKSLIHKSYFARKFGLTPKVIIYYSLKKLKKSEKIKFNYMLSGKKKSYGLLRKYGGKLLCPGQIEIATDHKDYFVQAIKKLTSDFTVKEILS